MFTIAVILVFFLFFHALS